ncbi:MAG TPA: YraN family protein [Flavobacteriales bacterium]|nr:YraN family protein [Flavobacteriales bacterium]
MAEHNRTGAEGEQLACRFLEAAGFEVLERNWQHGKLEIDIVARHERYIVFVEVKTRSSNQHGEPEEAVKKGKRSKLIQCIHTAHRYRPCGPLRHRERDPAPFGEALHPSHPRRVLSHHP